MTAQPLDRYALGSSNAELERLIQQAAHVGDLTAQVLQLAGLRPGMRVLDVGSGAGDVAFLAARFVGPEGEVIGVDQSSDAVALANRRAAAAGLSHVSFRVGDVAALELDGPVDAVIGRLVLMYFRDPAAVVRRLAGLARPGGIVAFQEFDLAAAHAEPRCELFEQATERLRRTFARVGVDDRAGLKLAQIFRDAGLPQPAMILGARVEHGLASSTHRELAGITRSLLPLIEQTGVAVAAEVDVDTLADRLQAQALANDATLVSPAYVGAWARLPEL